MMPKVDRLERNGGCIYIICERRSPGKKDTRWSLKVPSVGGTRLSCKAERGAGNGFTHIEKRRTRRINLNVTIYIVALIGIVYMCSVSRRSSDRFTVSFCVGC